MEMDEDILEVDESDHRSIMINIQDPIRLISSKEMINSIKSGDAAIDIIGVVNSIGAVREVQSNGRKLNVFNFSIQCEDDIQLPVAIWDEDIKTLKPFVSLDCITHIDSPYARPQVSSQWTNNRDFILTCRSNTVINVLGQVKAEEHLNMSMQDCRQFDSIQDCVDSVTNNEEIIALTVIVKTEFRKDGSKNARRVGAVTDNQQKLVVYIFDFDSSMILTKGQTIKMIGKLIDKDDKIYFEVMSTNDISILPNDIIDEEEFECITKTPKRKLEQLKPEDCIEMNKENQVLNKSLMEKKMKLE